MIDSEYTVASWFLWISATGFMLVYVLPLTFAPLAWAKLFQWRVPEDTDLTVYFARCVGVLAGSISLFAMRAALDPEAHRYLFEIIFMVCAGMTLLHVYGAVRRVQPWTEDAEILLYGGITVLSWLILGTLPV